MPEKRRSPWLAWDRIKRQCVVHPKCGTKQALSQYDRSLARKCIVNATRCIYAYFIIRRHDCVPATPIAFQRAKLTAPQCNRFFPLLSRAGIQLSTLFIGIRNGNG